VKQIYIGYFATEREAAKGYDNVAKEFSNKKLNFPEDYLNHKFVKGEKETDVQVAAAEEVIESLRETAKANTSSKQSSKYTGVSYVSARNKWVARIHIRGTQIYLGLFTSELEAAKAYDNVAKILQ
jgi:hypothetical protein